MLKTLARLVYKYFNIEARYRGNWRKDNKWLIDYNFKTIVDVGANEGQFAMKMRRFFPAAQIISFEPIPDIYNKLNENFAGDSGFKAHCLGLGEKKETSSFFLNDYSASSSMLKLGDHMDHFDKASSGKEITINIDRLDDVVKPADIKRPLFVKLDVQGFEDRVINGGMEVIKQADLIMCEVSFKTLYEDQKLFDDIYYMLKGLGFAYHGNYEQLHSPVTNEVLQADAIFVRRNPSAK
ncbi:MAG: FkbM family methyltransferase [Sphingobacteriales bacterium]|nr:MAG: FkbM family methyltransferase [Sphingobacteriales bacterium]